jgi:hypothetical protein
LNFDSPTPKGEGGYALLNSEQDRPDIHGYAEGVRLSSGRQAFGFQSEQSEEIFDYTLRSFVNEHFVEKRSADSSGWRSLVDIAQGVGAAKTSHYSPAASGPLRELLRKGVVERKVLTRQRGRGGRVTRIRIAYERGFVKEYVDSYMQK